MAEQITTAALVVNENVDGCQISLCNVTNRRKVFLLLRERERVYYNNSLSLSHTHTHTNTYIHSYGEAHTHTRTHTHTHLYLTKKSICKAVSL